MNFIRVYDFHTKAREQLFGWIRPLSQNAYTQRFPMGLGTLRATLIEIARSEHFYVLRLREMPVPPFDDNYPVSERRFPTFPELEQWWTWQAAETRASLSSVKDWGQAVTTRVVRPAGSLALTATKADIATQLLLHEVHHRAQAMAMLRQLGIVAENLDYITFVQHRTELT